MEQLKKGVRTLATTGLAVLMCLVLLWLLLLSIFNTYYLDRLENMLALHGNITFAVLGIFAVLALFVAGNRLRGRIKMPSRATCDKITIVFGVLAALYAVAVQSTPLYDQMYLLNIANEMHAGDFSAFFPGGYVYRCPHQCGLILFYYVVQLVFGGSNYMFAQLLNAVSLFVIWRCMYRLAEAWFGDGIRARLVLFSMLAFLPFTLYVTFVYGNLYGMALSMAAFVMLQRWFSQRKWKYIAAGGLLMALAVQAKSNYLVYFLAYALIILLDAIIRHKASFAGLALSIVLVLCGNLGVNAAVYAITGMERPQGMPSLSYVALGLQQEPESAEYIHAPGYYTSLYNYIFKVNDFDNERVEAVLWDEIHQHVGAFIEDPAHGASFFSQKTAAQWADPTFESLHVQVSRPNNVKLAPWYTLLSTQNSMLEQSYIAVFDVFQSVIYFGAFAYFFLRLRRGEIFQWFLAIAFFGGFLFHVVWEAKAQYTLFYFMLLMPYAVQGYADCAHAFTKRPVRGVGVCAGGVALLLLMIVTPVHRAVALEQQRGKDWFRRTTIERSAPFETGDYTITCCHGNSSVTVHLAMLRDYPVDPFYYIVTYEGRPVAPDASSGVPFDFNGRSVTLAPTDYGSTRAQSHWLLQQSSDGSGYAIVLQPKDEGVQTGEVEPTLWAVTCGGDTVTLQKLDEETTLPEQAFQIVKDDGAHP